MYTGDYVAPISLIVHGFSDRKDHNIEIHNRWYERRLAGGYVNTHAYE